jgi:hypothetical protein
VAARAQTNQFHPSEPPVNLGDTSFLDGVAGPGVLVQEIVDGYHGGKVGSAIPATDTITSTTLFGWLGNRRIFGAWYGFEIVPAAAHVHVDHVGSAGGLGDLTVSPLNLQWGEKKIFGIPVYQRVVFDFGLPTGQYDRRSAVNLSSHAFSVHPYYAITAFPAKRWETSWRIHYLWNSANHAPPLATGLRSTQAGQAVHFNATIGYELAHGLWIGANGYYLKQVTNPYVNGVQLHHSPEQVGAIGLGATWGLGPFRLYANYYHELGAVNRPEGDKVVLLLEWLPEKKVPPKRAD